MRFVRPYNRGVTVIEMLLAVFITTVVGIAVTAFARTILRNSAMAKNALTTQSQARKLSQSFVSEVRSALPAWDGSAIVDTASSSSFIFYANLDTDKYTEKVRYFSSSTKLYKGVKKYNIATGVYDLPETLTLILSNLSPASSTSLFSYYDKDYTGSSTYAKLPDPVDISRIRLVKFDLSVNPYAGYTKSVEVFSTQAALRNLKDNY